MRRHINWGLVVVASFGLVAVSALTGPRPLGAQQAGGLPALERRVAALEVAVGALQKVNAGQAAEIAALKQKVVAAEAKLAFVSVQGRDMFITGANLHLRNGLGATNGYPQNPRSLDPGEIEVNGLGNLIIGYNALRGFEDDRSGSHTLVLGDFNSFNSFGGVAAGWANDALAPYASTLGGRSNRVTAEWSTIVGGAFGQADGSTSSILGGDNNRTSEIDTTVCGGESNHAAARFATVGGGAGIVQGTEFGWSAGSFGLAIQGSFISP